MKIKLKTDEKSGEYYFDLADLAEYLDPEQVAFYTLDTVYDDAGQAIGLTLKFYDTEGRIKLKRLDIILDII